MMYCALALEATVVLPKCCAALYASPGRPLLTPCTVTGRYDSDSAGELSYHTLTLPAPSIGAAGLPTWAALVGQVVAPVATPWQNSRVESCQCSPGVYRPLR